MTLCIPAVQSVIEVINF